MVTVGELVQVMERLAPRCLAETWDNPGLHVGSPEWPVKLIWVALDPTQGLIQQAVDNHVNLVITHHPLIFRPLYSVDLGTQPGRIIELALKNQVALLCAHTNLDSARGGVNDMLAEKVGLKSFEVLKPVENSRCREVVNDLYPVHGHSEMEGLGRIGNLPEPISFEALVDRIKKEFALSTVKTAGNPVQDVRRIAVCGGSGRSLLGDFLRSDADVFISGDMGYHDGQQVADLGKGLIDIGHFSSEHVMVEGLARQLSTCLASTEHDVAVVPFSGEKDCFRYL